MTCRAHRAPYIHVNSKTDAAQWIRDNVTLRHHGQWVNLPNGYGWEYRISDNLSYFFYRIR